MKLFVVALIAATALAEVSASCGTYADFKSKHGKKYDTIEDAKRKTQWKSSCSKISAHNALYDKGQVSYQLTDNFMADLTDDERQMYMGSVSSELSSRSIERMNLPMGRAFSDTLDLTTSKCMPAIKDQGKYGSCWAFAAINPIEWQLCGMTGKLTLLSKGPGHDGCKGSAANDAWKYIMKAVGLTSSAVNPYSGKASTCTFNNSTAVVNLMGLGYLAKNETMIQQFIYNYGPVAVSIWASDKFHFYNKGIFLDPSCRTDKHNHAVNLVGYGTDTTDGPYWILRNQWGTGWGQKGYMKMARGANQCGVANNVDFPVVYG